MIEIKNIQNDYEKAVFLQNMLIGMATQDNYQINGTQYKELRSYFYKHEHLPNWVKDNRCLDAFWQFIKQKFATYQERRDFIRNDFCSMLNILEEVTSSTFDSISDQIDKITTTNLSEYWSKALERIDDDPGGAITLAKTLLEGTCKEILDKLNLSYDHIEELPKLYKMTANAINLHSSQHTEKIFKNVLGGCSAVVNGLGCLRNKLGDAHHSKVKPLSRHAKLVVNLAGTMSEFLLQTAEACKTMTPKNTSTPPNPL